jgi:hypothetical protein
VVVLVGDGRHEPGVLVHVVLDDLQPAVGEPGPVVDFSCVHFSCFSAEFSAEIQEKKILRNKFSGNFPRKKGNKSAPGVKTRFTYVHKLISHYV